ncbi:MAG TPA: hypothetical protein V6C82_02315, partial [Chroococcales cyanobacterium]
MNEITSEGATRRANALLALKIPRPVPPPSSKTPAARLEQDQNQARATDIAPPPDFELNRVHLASGNNLSPALSPEP